MNKQLFLPADWPAPARVRAGTTRRSGGLSQPPYASLNLAQHVGDDPDTVQANRARLGLAMEPVWLNQVHGCQVVRLDEHSQGVMEADAAYTDRPGVVCVVLTADCLPLLVCDRAGTQVAAIHAGWRGLAQGVIEACLDQFTGPVDQLLVWLGPAIGPAAYEVGAEVRQAFVAQDPQAAAAFSATRPGHGLMDIYALARQRLAGLGVTQIYGGDLCTYTGAESFYSYRREGVTGRMASLIWLSP